MKVLHSAAFAVVLILVSGLVAADAPQPLPAEPVPPDLTAMAQQRGGPWTEPLMPMFERAADKHNVPLPLLLALGYFGSAFENRGDAPTIENGFGVMALREKNRWNSDTLGEGEGLTNVPRAQLKMNPLANINAAAAVLSAYANQMGIDRSQGFQAWLGPVIKYAGLDEEYSRMFAMEVFEKLLTGLDWTNSSGERFQFDRQDISGVDLSDLEPRSARRVYPGRSDTSAQSEISAQAVSPIERPTTGDISVDAGYGGAIWYPAASCNYTATYCAKNTAVIHTIQGTAAGCLSWFRNCNSQVSAHYVVSEAGGVWQCVDENYKAWHVGCANSYCIGDENEGYAESPSHPASLYNAAGLLFRDICNRWGIPKQHNGCPPGILGHIDINNCVCFGSHWDPGGGWDWGYFIGVVQGAPPPPTYAAHYVGQSYPATMVAGSTAVAWAEYMNDGTATWGHAATRLGTQGPQDRCSPFFESGNWINCGRPTEVDQSAVSTGQVGRFTFVLRAPTTPGNYTEQFRPLEEGVTWFGGDVTWWITVTAATGTITGTVRNSATGLGISGATVSIAGGASTGTNSSGVYTFNGVNVGSYTLTASASGYNPSSAPVTVSSGATTTQDFSLAPADTQAPTIPTNLAATPVLPTQINLSWTASTDNVGVAGYKVYRNGGQIGTSGTTSYADPGLTPNTAYSYQVSAYDAAGNQSALCTAVIGTTPPSEYILDNGVCELAGAWSTGTSSTDKYGADYLFASTAVSETKSATWRPNLVAGGTFDVYCWYPIGTNRATNSPFTVYWSGGSQTISVNQQVSGGQWVLLVTGKTFAAGTSGYVKLGNGTGATGKVVVADAVRFVMTSVDAVPPSVPTGLSATPVSMTQVNLAWNASTDNISVAGYNIYRDGVKIGSTANLNYSDTTCAVYTTYAYRVSAYDGAGNESALCTAVNATTFADSVAPTAPTNLTANAVSQTQVDLAWSASSDNVGVTGYKIFRDGAQIGVSATTAYSDATCTIGTTYAYEVSAYDAAGNESPKSLPTEVTTPGNDTEAPSVPANLAANGASATEIDLAWEGSTDNVGVAGYKIFRNGAQIGTSALTSYADTTCSEATTYTYEVSAYDITGNESAKSSPASATTLDVTAPSVPTGLAASAVSETQVNLTWTASTDNVGVTSYKVFRNGAEIGTSATASYSDTGLTPATTYTYEVSALDAASNESAKSGAASATTPDTTPPSVPANLAATAVSGTQVNLTWTASTDNVAVTGYKVFRNGAQIGTSATGSYSDTGLTPATTYTYEVSAFDAASNESAKSAAATATTPDTIAPSVPTNLSATAVSGTQVNLAWTASTDNVAVTGYKVFRGGVQIGTSATTSYSDMTCAPGNTYTYEVSAYDAAANESAKSNAAIATTADTTPPTAPTGLTATAASQTQVNLAWNASTDNVGVVGYKIYRNGAFLISVAGLSYSDTSCQSYTAYTYQVTAYDAASNESAGSNQAQVTTPAFTDIAMDNPTATYVGTWFTGTASPDKYGADYQYCTTAATETKTATWTPKIDISGYYTVYVWYPQGANRSTMAPFTIVWDGSQQTVNVNQTAGGGAWVALVTNKRFLAGTAGYVKLGNGTGETSLNVMADAVRFLLISDDLTAPSVPTNLAATAASATQINLTWTASTDNVGVTGYRIFRNGAAVGTSTGTSYSDTGLTQLTTYTYTVSAYDAMGNESAQSSSANATTWDGTPPTVPTGLTATAISPTRISLSWTASTDNVGVTGYKIYRGGAYVATSATTSYTDTGRSPSTNYSYTVSAIDARNNESAQSTAANATTPAFAEIIIDNPAATYTGVWTTATSSTDKYGADYKYASTAVTEGKTASWTPTIQYAGNYNVYIWYTIGSNRATNAPYTTYWDGGNATVNVNQTVSGGQWVLLQSSKHFAAGTAGYVKLGNGTGATGKVVIADAVRYVQVSGD